MDTEDEYSLKKNQYDATEAIKKFLAACILITLGLQSCTRTFFIGLTPKLFHSLAYSLIQIGILLGSGGVGSLFGILVIKQYAQLKQRIRISFGICAFLTAVSCFLMAIPYFLPQKDSNSINVHNQTSQNRENHDDGLDIADLEIGIPLGFQKESWVTVVFITQIGAQFLVGCVSFALTVAVENSEGIGLLSNTSLWSKLIFGLPIAGEALGYIAAASVSGSDNAWIHLYTLFGFCLLTLAVPILVIRDTDVEEHDAKEQSVLLHWVSHKGATSWRSVFSPRFICALVSVVLSAYFLQTTALVLPVLLNTFYCLPVFSCALIAGIIWTACFNLAPFVGWHFVCSTKRFYSRTVLRFVLIAWCFVGILYLACMPFDCEYSTKNDRFSDIELLEQFDRKTIDEYHQTAISKKHICTKQAAVFCLLISAALFAGNFLSRALKCSAGQQDNNFIGEAPDVQRQFETEIGNVRSHTIRVCFHIFGLIPAPIILMAILHFSNPELHLHFSSLLLQPDGCSTDPMRGFCIFMGITIFMAICSLIPFGFGSYASRNT